MPTPLEFTLEDEAATRAFGARLAGVLPDRAVIAVDGDLGAGKTRFSQGLAAAVGIDADSVLSPTYTLIHEYPFQRNGANRTLYHLDAYRVHDPAEFWELGIEELYAEENWVVIEWASKVAVCLPDDYLHIFLEVVTPNSRRALLTAHGPKAEQTLARLQSAST